MRSRDGRLASLVGLTLFTYYLLTLGGHQYSIDGILTFQSAKQLFFRHSLVLDPPVRWGGTVFYASGHSIGQTLAYLPVLALWSPLAYWMPSLQSIPYNPAVAYNRELYGNLPYLLCSWLNPLITAATGCLVFALGRRLGLTAGWAVAAALAWGLASPAAAYARYDFSQPLGALALTAAIWSLLGLGDGLRVRALVGAGAALGFGFLTRPEFAVLIAWIIGWLLVHPRQRGLRAMIARSAAVAGPVLVAAVVYLWINRLKFGAVGRTGYDPPLAMFPSSLWGPLEGIIGLLASPGRGLLFFFPLMWLALPGLVKLIKERHPTGILWTGLIVSAFALYGSLSFWPGGWSWGPRYLVPFLPMIALAATWWTSDSRQRSPARRRRIFLALAGLGVLVSWTGILFDFVLYYRWLHGTVGIPDHPSSNFLLSASPLVSGWRFLPMSSVDLLLVRLGQIAGPSGVVAALVIATALLGCLIWSGLRIRALLSQSPEVRGRYV